MSSDSTEQGRGTPPVFIPCRNLPDNTEHSGQYTVREICAASEKTSGYNSVIGAQKIGGLWRVYPRNVDSRAALLLKGIEVRNHTVNPFDKNPYIVRTPQGEGEVQTTKVIIGNLPMSYSNDEIERKLIQLGCEPHSKLMMERDRDERGGLTRWLTGRRFVYIKIPDRILPEKINIGTATATLYHREQKNKPENAVCSRCLTKGHRASTCANDIVCRTCKRPGHKSGHPSCTLTPDENSNADAEKEAQESTATDDPTLVQASGDGQSAPAKTTASTTTSKTSAPSVTPLKPSGKERGREAKQPTIKFPWRTQSVPREKRPRSSPLQHPEPAKTARTEEPPKQPGDPPSEEAALQEEKDPAVT